MITFKNITKKFHVDFWAKPFVALEELSFDIGSGEIIGFLGANGAGKTTSMKIMLDFVRPDSGKVEYSPILGKKRSEILKNIGFMPERPYFYPHLTGREFLTYMAALNDVPTKEIKSRIEKLTGQLSIAFAVDRKIHGYSKGMLQRLGMISAIIHNPKFIVLDEPLSGLDPIGRKDMRNVIIELQKEGKTVLFSSHIIPDVEEVCSRLIFIDKGKLIYEGSTEKLIRSKATSKSLIKFYAKETQVNGLSFEATKVVDGFYSIESSDLEKQNILQHLITKDIEIESIENMSIGLEDALYNVKN